MTGLEESTPGVSPTAAGRIEPVGHLAARDPMRPAALPISRHSTDEQRTPAL
jgi:hypothetical protein